MAIVTHVQSDYNIPSINTIECDYCDGRGYKFVDVPAYDSEKYEEELYDLDTETCDHCGGEGFLTVEE